MHPSLCELSDTPVVEEGRVWQANLDALSEHEVEQLGGSLCATECARATKFHFDRDRRRYIAARGLLRSLLGSITDQSASALVFTYGPHGKPALASANGSTSSIRFNLSHAAAWAMFAVAQGREVGIDVESAARLDRDEEHLARFAATILSVNELAIWRQLSSADARRSALLRAWTRKEAYAKATGVGLAAAMGSIEVALDAAEPRELLKLPPAHFEGGLTSGWLLHDLAAPHGFAAALAIELGEC